MVLRTRFNEMIRAAASTDIPFPSFPWVRDTYKSTGDPMLCRCGRYAWWSTLSRTMHHYANPERGCDFIPPEVRTAPFERQVLQQSTLKRRRRK